MDRCDIEPRRIIGLYGPHNMWYVTRRSLTLSDIDVYSLTYDDNEEAPCKSLVYGILPRGTPTYYLTHDRENYEKDVSTKLLLEMMDPFKPECIRTFNSITDNIEIVSHTHLKVENRIISLNDLTVNIRRKIWDLIYPKVFDIVGDESSTSYLQEIQSNDYVFAISSCITPLIVNGGIMPHEERLRSTIEQVKSIRKVCPQAKIFLLESSAINFDDIERLYDHVDYIFLFQKNVINDRLARTDKSLGESYVLHSLLKRLLSYKLFIKVSGRYKLLNSFKVENLSVEKPTFRITPKEITWSKRGVCESILYSIPYQCHKRLMDLLAQICRGHLDIDIEHCLYKCFCPGDDMSNIHQVDELFAYGMMAGHPGVINRT